MAASNVAYWMAQKSSAIGASVSQTVAEYFCVYDRIFSSYLLSLSAKEF